MNDVVLCALCLAAAVAAAVAAGRWVGRPFEKDNRPARVQQQRDQRIEEVNARLRPGRPTPRPVTLADIQALDQQLTDLDQIANRIQPLYVREEQQ